MKKILVCTDGSAYAQVCYEYAAWLAQRVGARLEILYVTDLRQFEVPMIADLSGSLGVQPYQAILGQLQDLEQEKAKAILQEAERAFAEHGLGDRLTLTHRTGFLVDSLHDFEAESDLILLGKRGENANFATEHLGSTMERVVRSTAKPCLVTSRSYRPIERLLLAYDGGKSCQKALQFLVESQGFRGLELHIVTVAGRHEEESALENLRAAESTAKTGGFSPVCQMMHGIPEQEISSYVETQNIHALIMGAYGHSRIRQFIIGSTTTEMIRRCRIPVLLFR